MNYNWGIMACGHIASRFAEGLASTGKEFIKAVASRSENKAKAFAAKFDIKKAYGDYQSLANDPEIDIVYIASPHPMHHENALLCLRNGKHVLCEKPLTVNAKQAKELIDTAREKQLFLMEAIWTRFLPVMVQVRSWLTDGIIGEPRLIRAGFNFRANELDPNSRLFNPSLGGGALLDVGIYPIMFASMVFGDSPTEIQSLASKAPTGVDYQSAYLFQYKNGAIASLSSGFESSGTMDAMIVGTEGEIRIPVFWKGSKAIITKPGGDFEEYAFPYRSSGLQYQAVHMMECLEQGLLESPVMPLDESLSLQQTMDTIRDKWGLKYPFED
ncbi:MAG: Gfo/Idh/MocA family oxidoreductase [Bacteroidia bacterium]|nr:Gfo/Idh/MocA family oxidoreductase [Bacteroidia bacterium]